ncbi:hypothetical protein NKF06_12820 [Haloferax sp. AB510]|uniref:hypothetical protein n=1 Tax=Haloferax sp. AB510 TaxID=2934172 RepID=UPI00209BEB4C|nr:hypothetical protein [Haloferax sp. AB510]MCO8267446.1 hypothetical protein [Haloferax sp. AB510]
MLAEIISILSMIVTAIIPIVGTVIAGLVLYAKQDYDRTQNMRRAFLAELTAVDLPIPVDVGDREIPLPYTSWMIPTAVYDNYIDNIGRLTSEEVEALVRFYSIAQEMDHLRAVMHGFQEPPGEEFKHLEKRKEVVVTELEQNLQTRFWGFLWNRTIGTRIS